MNRCAICGVPLTRFAAMCDTNLSSYCDRHWSGVGCYKLHGEGCATFVWSDEAERIATRKHEPETKTAPG